MNYLEKSEICYKFVFHNIYVDPCLGAGALKYDKGHT